MYCTAQRSKWSGHQLLLESLRFDHCENAEEPESIDYVGGPQRQSRSGHNPDADLSLEFSRDLAGKFIRDLPGHATRREFPARTEEMLNTWFVTDGEFDFSRTIGSTENLWSPPGAKPSNRGVIILVVTHDGRGGSAFQKIEMN